jgi:hypothetical protein
MKRTAASIAALAMTIITAWPATAQSGSVREERRANATASSLYSLMGDGIEPPAVADGAIRPPAGHDGERCTTDDLIHAEVSAEVTEQVKRTVTLLGKNLQLRDAARLYLPCGFHPDPRGEGNLVLGNGKETRRYRENNAFGFAPAFGFGTAVTRSYALRSEVIDGATLRPAPCQEVVRQHSMKIEPCAGFGNPGLFFGAAPADGFTEIAHYTAIGDAVNKDFPLARVTGSVVGLSFIASPDSPGGTVTLLIDDRGALYRAYVDTPRG